MKDILTAPWMVEMIRTADNMYRHGWDERNGGNISLRLEEDQVEDYLDLRQVIRKIPTGFSEPRLEGMYFLVTGTGKYFKNVPYDPACNLGLIRLAESDKTAQLLWGYTDGGSFTSELPAHMMSHGVRLKADPENSVVMHSHPTNMLAMNFVHDLDEAALRGRFGRCAPSAWWCSRRGSMYFRGCSAGPMRSDRPRQRK